MEVDCEDEDVSPPSSPILGYSGPRDKDNSFKQSGLVFSLCCKGQPKGNPSSATDTSFSPSGLILRRQLISAVETLESTKNLNILNNGTIGGTFPTPPETSDCFEGEEMAFFSHQGGPYDPLNLKNLRILISLCVKHLTALEILADPSLDYGGIPFDGEMEDDDDGGFEEEEENPFDKIGPWKLRQEICFFLNFILSKLSYYKGILDTREKLDEYFGVLRYSLSSSREWTNALQTHYGSKDGNECSSAMYHQFHLQLELRWFLLIIYGVDEEFVSLMLEDLIHLAWIKYSSELQSFSGGGLVSKQPFNCWCVKEIWTMLKLISDEVNKNFWTLFKSKLEKYIIPPEEGRHSKVDLLFSLWLTVYIASLSDYTLAGSYCPVREQMEQQNNVSNPAVNGYPLVHLIFEKWITNSSSKESKPEEINTLLTEITDFWGFDLKVFTSCWNYWLPQLDKTEKANGQFNVDIFSSNTVRWDQMIMAMCTRTNGDLTGVSGGTHSCHSMINSSGFLTFVKLVVSHARVAKGKDWKKLKSHMNTTVTNNKIKSLGEVGLLRLATIFLAMAYSTDDTINLCDRLTEFLQHARMTPGRQKTILLAQSTAVLLMLKKSIDIRLAKGTTPIFMTTVTDLMSQSGLDSVKKEAVMTYLSFLETLPYPSTPQFSDDSQHLGRNELISSNLTMWLSSCGPNYVIRTIHPLLKLTSWIISTRIKDPLSFCAERNQLASKISERCVAFLMPAVTLTVNRLPTTDLQPMAELAADLTMISKFQVSSGSPHEWLKLFDHFALLERTSPEVSQFYMQRLLSYDKDGMLIGDIGDTKIFQAFIRLNALNLKIPEPLIEKAVGPGFSESNNEEIFNRFCEIGEDEWSRGETLTALSPLVVLAKSAICTNLFKESGSASGASYLRGIVRAVSTVLQTFHYDKMYSRGDTTSMAFQLLNALIPPLVGVPPWEKLPKPVLNELKGRLFDIFKSLVKTTGCASDSFLQRKVQEIITLALLGYVGSLDEQLEDDHPIVKMCLYTENKELSLVINQIIPQLSTQLSNDSKLLHRFVLSVSSLRVKGLATTVLRFLPAILTIFVVNPPTLTGEISSATVSVIQYGCLFGSGPLRDTVVQAFDEVMQNHFAFKSKRFFELANFLLRSSKPRVKVFLRKELLPLLTEHVRLCEARRGSGIDNSLRMPLEKLDRDTKGFENLALS